jgi:hypothetical protein
VTAFQVNSFTIDRKAGTELLACAPAGYGVTGLRARSRVCDVSEQFTVAALDSSAGFEVVAVTT